MTTLLICFMLEQLPRPTTETRVTQVQQQGNSWQRWADGVDAKFTAVEGKLKGINDYKDEVTDMGKLLQQEIEASQDQIEDLKNRLKSMQLRADEKERAKKETP